MFEATSYDTINAELYDELWQDDVSETSFLVRNYRSRLVNNVD